MASRLGRGRDGLNWLHLLLMASLVLGLVRCSKLNPNRDSSEVVVVRVDENVCVDNCTAMLIRLQVANKTNLNRQPFTPTRPPKSFHTGGNYLVWHAMTFFIMRQLSIDI